MCAFLLRHWPRQPPAAKTPIRLLLECGGVSVAQTQAVNRLYDKLCTCCTLIQCMTRTVEKWVVSPQTNAPTPSATMTKHSPFERLWATHALVHERRNELQAVPDPTNPRELREETPAWIDHTFALPGAQAEKTENIYEIMNLINIADQSPERHKCVTSFV